MKRTPQQHFFLGLFLAGLVSTTTTAAGGTSRPPLASHNTQRRRLEDGGSGFEKWASDVWDNVIDSIGFGDDSDETSTTVGDNDNTGIEWGDAGSWDAWLSLALESLESGTDGVGDGVFSTELFDGSDVCPLVESAIGMGSGFGIEANCSCDGDFETGLDINCRFDACASGESEICGTVKLDFAFGGPDGTIDMSACADFEDDPFKETCFSYTMDVRGEDGTLFDQTCAATYGGQDCACTIENGICLSIDCSAFVPGAKVDTCQVLNMVDAGDLESWIPAFDIFQPGFELQAGEIPWADLDLANLDYDNFDPSTIRWGDDFSGATWTDLLGGNPNFLTAEGLSAGTCNLMARAVDLSDELGAEGNCDCRYDETTGVLDLSCSFSETCTGDDDNDATSAMGLPRLCGSVNLSLTYASLDEVYADVCVQYDDFPETCYTYGIPFASDPVFVPPPLVIEGPGSSGNNDENGASLDTGGDLTTIPTAIRDCSARYGGPGNDCKCTIDANNCLVVDCTDFEPLAVTDDCQVIGLNNTSASRMIPEFRPPGADDVVSDGDGGAFVASAARGSDTKASSAGRVACACTSTATALGLFGLLLLAGQLW